MVPTLTRTLSIKGHRPVVGTRDNKDLAYVVGSLDLVSGKLVQRVVPSDTCTRRREGSHKTRRLQQAFADHLKDVSRAYPATEHERVVLVIDNAPWHRGAVVTEMLARHRHLELYRLPSYSPELNPIERLWKLLRHRVTHNRLFQTLSELTHALSRTLRALGRRKRQLLSLIMSQRKRAKLSTA